jgi:ketosteroid isomerase-like protein
MSLHVGAHVGTLDRVKPAAAIIEAFEQRDIETFLGNMTEDVVLRPSAFITGKSEYRGCDEVRSGLEEMNADLDARGEKVLIAVLTHYVDGEDHTKVLTLAHVTIVPAAGDHYGSKIAYLATLRDGRVSELETWLDHDAGLSQLKAPIAVRGT